MILPRTTAHLETVDSEDDDCTLCPKHGCVEYWTGLQVDLHSTHTAFAG